MADRTAPVVKLTLTLTLILPGQQEWDGVSEAVEPKPEVEIWRDPKNQLFDPDFLFTPSDSF